MSLNRARFAGDMPISVKVMMGNGACFAATAPPLCGVLQEKMHSLRGTGGQMNRLTKRTTCGVANLAYTESCYFKSGAKDQIAVSAFRQRAIERLAEYEDAEEQGLLIKLPCKVGDIVYRFQRYFNDDTRETEIKIQPCEVARFSNNSIITTDYVVMLFSEFGKKVFLTREEAEKALEG